MQRDIGNEFIVAIIAVGILAFAVAFAIILSLSGGAGQDVTATPPNTVVALASFTVSADVEQPPHPTETDSIELIQSPTLKASNTGKPLTPTATSTEINNSARTPVTTQTPTQIQVTVAASTSTATQTVIPPTFTATSIIHPTMTPSMPSTRVRPLPTRTLKPTITSQPTSKITTSTFTPTFTASATATPTPTITHTASATLTPTQTPTIVPSATALPTATVTPTPTNTRAAPSPTVVGGEINNTSAVTNAPCTIPSDWTTYLVKRGDTLLTIAQKSGTTVALIQATNCVPDVDNIYVGQIIYIPPISNSTGSISYKLDGCTDSNTIITNLTVGQIVSGIINVEGSATNESFAFYKLEIRPDSGNVYTLYNSYIKPVTRGSLGEIDTRIFSPGIYWVKLTVITQDNAATPSCALPLLFALTK